MSNGGLTWTLEDQMLLLSHIGQHGGICYDLQASYMCYCPDGKFRSQCLPRMSKKCCRMDVATIRLAPLGATSTARTLICPCQNGGMCPTVGSQSCICPTGFTGRYCERLSRKRWYPDHHCLSMFPGFYRSRQLQSNSMPEWWHLLCQCNESHGCITMYM